MTPILYDSHMHTPLCKHASGAPTDYAAVAHKRGLKGIIFTCHNPGPEGWSTNVRMAMHEFDRYVEMVAEARAAWNGRVDVRLGLECDYMPGFEPWLEAVLAKADFHHVIGSIHPQLDYYKAAHYHDDPRAYIETYFDHLAQSAETGLFDTIAHPDLVKNIFPRRWNVHELLDVVKRSLDRIARAGAALELNTSGLQKAVQEMNPNRHMLVAMRTRSIPVVLGSDAHKPERVAGDFEAALDLLAEVGYTHVSLYLDRRRQEISIPDARASLL
jgi:histidinol-phosphatase (PHP family)